MQSLKPMRNGGAAGWKSSPGPANCRRREHSLRVLYVRFRMRSMTTETEAVKAFYSAVNRNDMQTIIKHFDPEIVRIEPEGFPTAGTYRGIAEVQENVRTGRGTWAEGSCDPEKFLINGDKVVV